MRSLCTSGSRSDTFRQGLRINFVRKKQQNKLRLQTYLHKRCGAFAGSRQFKARPSVSRIWLRVDHVRRRYERNEAANTEGAHWERRNSIGQADCPMVNICTSDKLTVRIFLSLLFLSGTQEALFRQLASAVPDVTNRRGSNLQSGAALTVFVARM